MAAYPGTVYDPYAPGYPYRNEDNWTQVNTNYMNERDNEIVAIEAVLGANLAPVPGSAGARPLSDRLKLRGDEILQVGRINDPGLDAGVQLRVGSDDCGRSWLDIRKPSSIGPMEIQSRIIPSGGVETTADLALQPDGGKIGIGTTAPLGLLHVQSSVAAGGSVSSTADDLVVESNTDTGMTLLAGPGADVAVEFVSGSAPQKGVVRYDGATRNMTIGPTGGTGGPGGTPATLTLRGGLDPQAVVIANGGVTTFSSLVNAPDFTLTGDHLRLRTPSTVDNDPTSGTLGLQGDIRWGAVGGVDYLYIYTGATPGGTEGRGGWKRVQLDAFS